MNQVPTRISVGLALRTAREGAGRSVAEIANELCITPTYVRAIEAGDLKSLPGVFFYKSFSKQYASILNLDVKTLALDLVVSSETGGAALESMPAGSISSYRPPVRTIEPLVADTNTRYISDRPMSWSVAILVAVLAACSGFYSWWYRTPAAASARPAAIETPIAVQPSTAAPVAAVVESTPAQPESIAASMTDVTGIVLDLSATERTWLSITSNGRQIFSGILRPSESKKLGGIDQATLKVGNAAGIEIRWNGKPIGPLGGRGQVRTVQFTPESVQILNPPEALSPDAL